MQANEDYQTIKNICCIGAGYVGGPTMAVMADKCPNIRVTVVDKDEKKINLWNSDNLDNLPVFEPFLSEIIKRTRFKNLFFSNDINNAIKNADMVFISVNTPIKTSGIGAGQASNLKWVESCARQIGEAAEGYTIVVEKSTLPVKTAQTIKDILSFYSLSSQGSHDKIKFSILSNPEFLSEGSAINDLENPDRVLIGGEDHIAVNKLKDIYFNWIPSEKIICTNLWSSELSKLISNAFLAQRISSINSVAAICEESGADVREVSKAIGSDRRIGKEFLNAGPGFGGSCFKKDVLNLVYLCRHFGLEEVANYWEQVVLINSWNQRRIYKIIVQKLFGNIAGKKLAVFGYAFKANTNDTRESPSRAIIKSLLSEEAIIAIHDPKVFESQISNELEEDLNKIKINNASKNKMWTFSRDIYETVKGADAIIILTEWDMYSNLNWEKISSLMRHPAWVFDTRSIVNKVEVRTSGINFWRIGGSN